ncbi:MAG: sterol desaturase family protein [Sediminibacterium sp. Gen4]|jgi:alkylglycerol monooxygenase|uniref:sterol desaturase family protein n=1 Tax=unclassified Sediminibacterium TaxID=2635961 RepID=UPI0015BF1D1D|nr:MULTISPECIES: sterol desaturase family protein [unclassified Sediminibacterium]MBW0162374.1 sterol desaturase family protein [Sediminibacterium sp.]MBW0164660.1 sterol desaturase family protein [Sediminibacterium sp.]NWK66021.1 sterol desaturase family protein [Sediminibacterium sp. Gen4]
METYGKIILIAMPAFLLLVLFEKWYGWYRGKETVRTLDMISSLSSGITNVTKDVLGLSLVVISYEWMVNKLAITQVPNGFFTYLIAFIALDFAGYWIHRIAHEYNIFWNNHIIHHSSEDFNLACALRQSISSIIKIFTVFLLPAAILGVPGQVIAIVAPLHLFAQFWYHTQHIGKMGFLENIIVTPSHHRVHHAINKEYMDKNYGQIFIIWDKLFGTYQEELADVPAVYGITRPVRTWNPIKINFMHLWLLIKDAWHAQRWKDKLRIWFMPTGWRPDDVAAKFPVYKIEDVYHFEKYDTGHTKTMVTWSWVQLTITLLFISYLFGNIAAIGSPNMFIYGAFVFLQVYAFTELMDRSKYAWIWETFKTIFGLSILLQSNDWFGLSQYTSLAVPVLTGYFVLSLMVCLYFVLKENIEIRNVK